MRAWWPVLAAGALIASGFVGELIVEGVFEEGRRSFSPEGAVVLDAVVRIVAVALILGFAWLVLSGPRQRLPGLVLFLVGGYLAVVPAVSFVVSASTGTAMPPLTLEVYRYPVGVLLWMGAAVMVMGLFTLVRPTHSDPSIHQESLQPADRTEVSPQPR